MPEINYLPHVADPLTRICLYPPGNQLSAEIIRQLQNYPDIKITLLQEYTSHLQCDYLILFPQSADFNLQPWVDLTLQNSASLIFITSPALRTTALIPQLTLIQKQHGFLFQVVNFEQSLPLDQFAAGVLSKIIYHFQPPSPPAPDIHLSADIASPPPPASDQLPSLTINPPALNSSSVPPSPAILSTNRRPLLYRYLLWFFLSMCGLFFLPFLFLVGLQDCISSSLSRSAWQTAMTCSGVSAAGYQLLTAPQNLFPVISSLNQLFRLPPTEVGEYYSHLNSSLNAISKLEHFSSSLLQVILNPLQPTNPDLSHYQFLLTTAQESLAYLEADLRQLIKLGYTPSPSVASFVTNSRSNLAASQLVLPDLPRLLSQKSKTTYLIVIQNHLSPQAVGGFVDSLVYFTLDQSHLQDFQVISVSAADKQISGQINAPLAYQQVTGLTYWDFSTSNFDPDFPTTASRWAWFAQKSLGVPVDVVIGVDTRFFHSLLNLTSGVYLTDHTLVNFSNFITLYRQSLLTSSSAFLPDLVRATVDRLKTFTPGQLNAVNSLIATALHRRQIQIFPVAFSLPTLSQVGWSGGLEPPYCRSPLPCYADFSYPLLTQISPGFTQNLPQLEVHHRSHLAPAKITSQVDIDLKVDSSARYYFRYYLPLGITLDSLQLNGLSLSVNSFSQTAEHGFSAFGIILPAGVSHRLQISYHHSLPPASALHYQLDIPAFRTAVQAKYNLEFTFPPAWAALVYPSSVVPVASPGSLRYNTIPVQDQQLDLDLSLSAL